MDIGAATDTVGQPDAASERVAIPAHGHTIPGRPAIPGDLLLRALACVVVAVSIVHWVTQSSIMVISHQGTPDFSDYFTAGLILRDNVHAHLYDPQLLRATANAHHSFLVKNYAFYLYPPLLAILMIPLTFLPFMTAARVWMCLSFVLWILNTALVADLLRYALLNGRVHTARRDAFEITASSRGLLTRAVHFVRGLSDVTIISIAVAAFLCLTSYTLELGVELGQVAMLILFLILLAPWLIRRGHPVLGGIVLAVAALIKVFPFVLIGYYVLRGRWRVVIGAVIGLAVLILGMTLVVGPAAMLAAPAAIFADGRASGVQFQNQSLQRIPLWVAAIFGRHPGSLTGKIGYALVALAALAFCAGILYVGRRGGRRVAKGAYDAAGTMLLDMLGYCWAIATMLLMAPNSWAHDFSWLLPVTVFCIGIAIYRLASGTRASDGRLKPEAWIVAVLAFGYALTMFPLPFDYDGAELFYLGPHFFIFWVRPFFMIERPLGAILIWFCAGILFLRYSLSPRQAAPEDTLPRAESSQWPATVSAGGR